MNTPNQPPASSESDPAGDARDNASLLSLSRLREAFAQMLGAQGEADSSAPRSRVSPKLGDGSLGENALRGSCEISPRSVVEAMLFVGRPDNGAVSAREMAAAMRGVIPAEIGAAVTALNAAYDEDGAPYQIEETNAGYRLVLRDEFERMRDKFYGRIREAKLSPAAIEVLSVVAYNEPVTIDQLNELRGAPSGTALSTLVRRKLVRLERPHEGASPHYRTTQRFLRLFGLETLAALPRSEELERA